MLVEIVAGGNAGKRVHYPHHIAIQALRCGTAREIGREQRVAKVSELKEAETAQPEAAPGRVRVRNPKGLSRSKGKKR